jgi:hypothetical protein
MKILKYVDEIDLVLNVIIDRSQLNELMYFDMIRHHLAILGVEKPEKTLRLQLRKLLADGYITNDKEFAEGKTVREVVYDSKLGKVSSTNTNLEDISKSLYWPTWEGMVFKEMGGYRCQYSRESRKTRRLLLQERIVWIASAATTLWFLFEVTKWIVERLDLVWCDCP